jgi:flagellar biogenesis protein FliO
MPSQEEGVRILLFQFPKKVEPMTEKQPLRSREKWVFCITAVTLLLLVWAAPFFSLGKAYAKTKSSPAKTARKTKTTTSASAEKGRFYIDEYEDPSSTKKEQGTLSTMFGSLFSALKYIFYLALVLAIGYLAVLGIKILMSRNQGFAGRGNDLINILETRYLAPNKALCLIEVGERLLLVGTGGANLEMISEFSDPAEVENLRSRARNKKDLLHPFQDQLNSFIKNFLTSDNNPPVDTWKENIKATTGSIHKKIVSLNDLRKSKESSKKPIVESVHLGDDDKDCSCPKCRLERIIKAK